MSPKQKHLSYGAILAGVFVCDRFLKNWAFREGRFIPNPHALWGLEINTIMGLAFLTVLIFFSIRSKPADRTYLWGISFMVLGALNNTLDKMKWGFIIDYIFTPRFGFNLSDLMIAAGAVLLVRHLWK